MSKEEERWDMRRRDLARPAGDCREEEVLPTATCAARVLLNAAKYLGIGERARPAASVPLPSTGVMLSPQAKHLRIANNRGPEPRFLVPRNDTGAWTRY